MKIAFFITDHGFGHAARSCHVIRELLKYREVEIRVISNVPGFLFEEFENIKEFSHAKRKVDVGVIQDSSISVNVSKTCQELEIYWRDFDVNVQEISQELSQWGAMTVLFDISPIGPQVACKLGLLSFGMSNFSWDWIYTAFTEEEPRFEAFIDKLQAAYDTTTVFFQYPYSPPLKTFCNAELHQIGWFGAASKHTPDYIRKKLDWNSDTYIFYTFGGHSFQELFDASTKWNIPDGFKIVIYHATLISCFEIPNVISLNREVLFPLQYIDLIEAADVVVMKPGFGIVAECIVNQKKVLYVRRGNFIEQDLLIKALQEQTVSNEVQVQDLMECNNNLLDLATKLAKTPIKDVEISNGDYEIAKLIVEKIKMSK